MSGHLERRRLGRTTGAVLAIVAVVIVVALGIRALSARDGSNGREASDGAGGRRDVPSPPADAPEIGMYVDSEVLSSGKVKVSHWIHSSTPVAKLEMLAADPDLLPGTVEALDVVVTDQDGTVLGQRDFVGTKPQLVRLHPASPDLYVSYVLDGAMADTTSTVQGRLLARVTAIDIDYDGQSGPVRHLLRGPGTVLNAACVRRDAGFDTPPTPCGRPTGDGDWEVDLSGPHRGDRLLAQLQTG